MRTSRRSVSGSRCCFLCNATWAQEQLAPTCVDAAGQCRGVNAAGSTRPSHAPAPLAAPMSAARILTPRAPTCPAACLVAVSGALNTAGVESISATCQLSSKPRASQATRSLSRSLPVFALYNDVLQTEVYLACPPRTCQVGHAQVVWAPNGHQSRLPQDQDHSDDPRQAGLSARAIADQLGPAHPSLSPKASKVTPCAATPSIWQGRFPSADDA
jgi:hypothetical protein